MPDRNHHTTCVIGGCGGIAAPVLERLHRQGHRTIASHNRQNPPPGSLADHWVHMDLTRQESIASATNRIRGLCGDGGLDAILICTGILHRRDMQPEKQLAQLQAEHFMTAMQINALGPIMVAQHLLPALSRTRPSTLSAISARVGSISDNRLGGWHSYRCSKAALNMGFRNIALELKRSHPKCVVSVYQPGTVDTALSRPFLGDSTDRECFSPSQAADYYLDVLRSLSPEDSGFMYDWSGKRIAF